MLGPRIKAMSSFRIEWYRTLTSTGTEQNLNQFSINQTGVVEIDEMKIVISTPSELFIVRSILTVVGLDTDDVSGEYWCKVEVTQDKTEVVVSGKEMIPSLFLHLPSAYQGLEACPAGVVHTSVENGSIGSGSSSSVSFTPGSTENASIKSESSTSPGTTTNVSFLSAKWIIIFSVFVGVLMFAVHVLLVVVVYLCCRGKRGGIKKKKGMHYILSSL